LYPAAHATHADRLLAGWYVPASHGVGVVKLPVGHLKPGGQAVKLAAPAASQKVLAGHGTHAAALFRPTWGWYVPAGHATEAVPEEGQ
jgi:hypothetical protein